MISEYPNFFSKWTYYLLSIKTLLTKIKSPFRTVLIFSGIFNPASFRAKLRNKLEFVARSRMDLWVIKETVLDGDYERDFLDIQNGWNVIDIGAAFGDFSVAIASRCPDSKVLAFEPYSESLKLLKENIALNGIENIKEFPLAVTSDGRPLVCNTEGVSEPGDFSPAAIEGEGGMEISSISLGDIFRDHIEYCDFLKMDCEGGEFDIILNSHPEVLEKISAIAMEYHDGLTSYHHSALVSYLEKSGFTVKLRKNPVHGDLGFLFALRNY